MAKTGNNHRSFDRSRRHGRSSIQSAVGRMGLALSMMCVSSASAAGEFYRIQNLFGNQGGPMYIENEYGHRFLQRNPIETGPRADLNQTSNTCRAAPPNVVCDVRATLEAEDGSGGDMDLQFVCDLDSLDRFDFRRARNCRCGITLKASDGTNKNCGCNICPDSFGDSPVSIQCEDDYAVGTCTSLDCGFGCNGTCNFGCDVAENCPFCEGNRFAPTVSPTGTGDANPGMGPTIGSGAAGFTSTIGSMVIGMVVAVAGMTCFDLVG